MEQLSIFNCFGTPYKQYKIDKPIRLIELFAGIGAQAMALRNIGANFEHYRVIEWDKFAVDSYNAIHGTKFTPTDIQTVKGVDLGIVDKSRFTYLLTYSFPCTSLSVAGKMEGMEEGSGTSSALLWEVKRLLSETEELPQILVMENVTQVHSEENLPHFQRWIDWLTSKGYTSFWKDLNAKDFGVAQSRERCFMVSILGDEVYTFPNGFELKKKMKDYLEDEVDEKYYLQNEKAKELIDKLIVGGKILTDRQTDRQTIDLCLTNPGPIEQANCICAKQRDIQTYQASGNGVVEYEKG